MFRLLLDEHVSPNVAEGVRRRRPSLTIHALRWWRNGRYLGRDDAAILDAAMDEQLTLVTYDSKTITPMLRTWSEYGRSHAGVIFVDHKTVSPANIGGLVKALCELADESALWEWKDRSHQLVR